MSLKPKKKSDLKKIENKMKRKESRMNTKESLPPYTMIVSEGTKTEPIYLRGFASKINEKYKDLVRENHIEVYGTGNNTNGLIRFVDRKRASGDWAKFQKIWLVYDKDDFPLDNFDNTQFEAESRKDVSMSVAWSNESIELWFVLHFQDYISNNGRSQYIQILNNYLDYSKVREDLFDLLMEQGSLENAKRRARKAYDEFIKSGITAPSGMAPATRMFELVEELQGYLQK